MSRYSRSALLSLAVAAALGQLPATASADAVELEEVIVTARKTEETLQSAPVAVTAFTARAIEEQGITNIDELARFSPGLSFSQAFGRTTDRPVIRGQSNVLAGVQFGVESGTAYFIDGVYFPGDIQGIDMSALERVEVVKGPQSALYGRNTYAGAINFITRPPGEGVEGYAKATVAEHGEQDYSLSIGSSFFDNRFGARLFARSFEYDGEYENTLTGKKVGDESTKSLGLSLFWQPIEDLEILASGFYREDDDGPLALFLQGATANNCRPGYRSTLYRDPAGPATSGNNANQYYCGRIRPGAVALNTDPLPVSVGGVPDVRDGTAFDGVETEEYFGTLRLDWDVAGSGWVVSSLSGYRDYENLFGTDSDHSDAFVLIPTFVPGQGLLWPPATEEPLFANTNRNDTRSLSTELRLASPQDRRLRGMFGIYYFDQEDDGSDLTFTNPKGGGTADYTETVTDEAVFGSLAYDITENLTLTAELRYMEETKERTEYCSTVNYSWLTQRCGTLPLGAVRYKEEKKFDSTTPRITLDWQLNDNVMVYGVFAQGAKPGGLNGLAGQSIGRPTYEQEESDNLEIGTKITGFDNRLRFNAAAYFTQATDVQFTQSVPSATGQGAVTSVVTNQGEGEIMGLELEVQAAISEALTLSAGYAYTHTEITKGCDDFEYTLNTGGLIYDPALGNVKECDISGNRYPLGPEQTANLSFNYDAPLAAGNGLNLIGNFGVAYEGSKYIQVHNLAETGESTLVNLRVGLRSDDGWSIVAFGRNLTDTDTIPLATRWFDLRTGSARVCGATVGAPCIPATPAPGTVGGGDTGSPRAFFGALRKGRTFGLEFTYDFKL